jgi:hypothetical protein
MPSLRKVPRHQPRQKPAVLSVSLLSALRASVLRRAISLLVSPQAATRALAKVAVGSFFAPAICVVATGCSTQRSLRSVWVARGLTLRSTGEPTAGRQARAGGTRCILTGPGLAACRRLPVNSNVRRRMSTQGTSSALMNSQDIAIPQLPSRSIEKTLAFYAKLGFEGEAVPGHGYAILLRGDVEIHFFQHDTLRPEESAFSCYLRVQDVETIYAAFSTVALPRKGIPRMEPLETKPWGMKEFAIIDEDGTLIRVGQEL